MSRILLAILIVTLNLNLAQAQLKETPRLWEQVKFDYDSKKYQDAGGLLRTDYHNFTDKRTRKGSKWGVFTTGDNTPVFKTPGGDVVRKLGFSTPLWVMNEKGEYLEVTDAVYGGNSIGWCKKTDLILWKRPLLDIRTGIEVKAFLVNNLLSADNIQLIKESKEMYRIFNSPTGTEPQPEKRYIYDVLFVFKYENPSGVEGKGRYLVSQYFELTSDELLLGWVEEARVKAWRTSICLEPNYEPKALEERATNRIMAKVFEADGSAAEMSKYYESGKGKGLFEGSFREPAFGDYKVNDRMYGRVFRYPVFDGFKDGNNCKFLTGASGKSSISNTGVVAGFNDDVYYRLTQKKERLDALMKNINVVYVIDGSEGMGRYLAAAAASISKLYERNVSAGVNTFKYGAVIYRNDDRRKSFEEEKESNFLQVMPLTNNGAELARNIEKTPAVETIVSNTEAVYFGIKKAIGMLKPNETNVIIHLGNSPDNTDDPFYEGKTKVTVSEIGTMLEDEVEAHYIGFATYTNTVGEEYRQFLFEQLGKELLPEMATAQSNKYSGVSFFETQRQPEAPKAVYTEDKVHQLVRMKNSPFFMKAYYLKNDYHTNFVTDRIVQEIDSCTFKTEELARMLATVVEDNSTLSDRADFFSSPTPGFLLRKLGANSDPETIKADKEYFAKEKIHIFVDATTWYRIAPLNEPLFKYVLFMPEENLDNKISRLGKLVSELEGSTASDVRKSLQEYWQKLAEEVLGGGNYKNITLQELQERMIGVEKMNIILPPVMGKFGDMKIDEITNKKKFSDEDFKNLLERVKSNKREMEIMRNVGEFYRIENSKFKFYWVPLEVLFG